MALHRPLLALSSQMAKASDVALEMGPAAGVAAGVAVGALDGWLHLRTARWSPGVASTYADRAAKRNVGLLVARMMGWERVLFLDDDISGLSPDMISSAVAHLGDRGPRVAGWRSRRFADNSVACHALRSAGDRQDVFIGAGAMLVDVRGWLAFFPSVYNEDWLFMHDFVTRREVGWIADVRQEPYNPFGQHERARREEFGDVLAEGLWALIHEKRSVLAACLPGYWVSVIRERRGMLEHIERRLWHRKELGHRHTWDSYEVGQVIASIAAAREALAGISPQHLAEFTSAWRHDLYLWNSRLPQLPQFSRIVDALNWLGIQDVHRASSR
jgi:hypothetical protein